MAPNELAILEKLGEEWREFRSDFRVFRTKLMGDDESEDSQGRIPRIEAGLSDHEKRIKQIERFGWAGRGGVFLMVAVAAAVEFVYYVLGVLKH